MWERRCRAVLQQRISCTTWHINFLVEIVVCVRACVLNDRKINILIKQINLRIEIYMVECQSGCSPVQNMYFDRISLTHHPTPPRLCTLQYTPN
jgi:hypothetical protein